MHLVVDSVGRMPYIQIINKAHRALPERRMKMTNEKIIAVTNAKFENWFTNVKLDYGVIGSGVATIEGEKITLTVTENGETNTYTDGLYDVPADYYFNVWAEGGYDE